MKSLVLAEKPSVARDLGRVLGCKNAGRYLENNRYIVTWALGHLVTLADPEHYGKEYKEWKLEILPIVPKKMNLVVIKQTSGQFAAIKELLNRKDIGDIIIATDAGREGELVARWILEKVGSKKPIKRLWISSVTDKSIKEGFAQLKDGNKYYGLYRSAQARAEADWLVGINATRALTTKYNAQLSCGRVQTPTLAMINSVEEDIRKFIPKTYYEIEAEIQIDGRKIIFYRYDAHSKENTRRIFDKEKAEEIVISMQNKAIEIKEITYQAKKVYPPGLYNLTELQRDANNRFGFSAKETLNIMQALYERHKLLTYPRTDSRYISDDIVPTIPERLRAVSIGEYGKLARKIKAIKPNSSFVDNKKVTDHHAIIPTEEAVFLNKLDEKERKIYDMVVKRFLAVLCPPCEYQEMLIKAQISDNYFIAKGKRMIVQGFREIYEIDDEDGELKSQNLPELKKGNYKVSAINKTKHNTTPPKPLNESTLLHSMESKNLGTVATRADIIEKLFDSFYVEKRGRDIFMTPKGKQLLELAPTELTTPDLTAKWELELEKISKNPNNENNFMKEIIGYTHKVIQEIKGSQKVYRHDNITGKKCPECNKNLLEVKGKKGKMLICQDRACGYRQQVSILTNARCQNCHKRMELIGEGEHRRFVCSCGFNERLNVFESRKAMESNQASKKETERYLKGQKDEGRGNTAIAEALKGLRFD